MVFDFLKSRTINTEINANITMTMTPAEKQKAYRERQRVKPKLVAMTNAEKQAKYRERKKVTKKVTEKVTRANSKSIGSKCISDDFGGGEVLEILEIEDKYLEWTGKTWNIATVKVVGDESGRTSEINTSRLDLI